jgi:hypothetical protein
VKPDGTKSDRWGPNPKAIRREWSFRAIHHAVRHPQAAKTVDQGTAEENKAVLAGFVAGFGTLSTIAAVSQSDSAAL